MIAVAVLALVAVLGVLFAVARLEKKIEEIVEDVDRCPECGRQKGRAA